MMLAVALLVLLVGVGLYALAYRVRNKPVSYGVGATGLVATLVGLALLITWIAA